MTSYRVAHKKCPHLFCKYFSFKVIFLSIFLINLKASILEFVWRVKQPEKWRHSWRNTSQAIDSFLAGQTISGLHTHGHFCENAYKSIAKQVITFKLIHNLVHLFINIFRKFQVCIVWGFLFTKFLLTYIFRPGLSDCGKSQLARAEWVNSVTLKRHGFC